MKKSVLHLFNFVMKQKCVSGVLLVKEMKFFFQTPFLRASPTNVEVRLSYPRLLEGGSSTGLEK